MRFKKYYLLSLLSLSALSAEAQEARLLRFPAVHGQQIVFSYAGDLYTVTRDGGQARKLTSHIGYEMFPRFSPDGKQIAFTAQYDGNTEVYVMPSNGGTPRRITYTPTLDRDDVADRMGPNNVVMSWSPDGKSIIYRGRGHSFNAFKGMLYKAPINGGLSEELPFSVASWATYNSDGSKLAMNRVFREFRTWKYYQGGMADDIWIFDTKSGKSENITNHPAQDIFPMYHKDKVYFMSDRDRITNLFEYNTKTKQTRKVTDFKEYDCKFPSLGDDAIAFENGGYIYLYHLQSEKLEKVNVNIQDDLVAARNKQVDAANNTTSIDIAPDGNRIVIAARGDVFTVPAKSGVTRNLTKSPGEHDRNVSWSPDGQYICFISDRTGEDELYLQKQDGSEPAKALTKGGGAYKFQPKWSPDSKKILLADRQQDLYVISVDSGKKEMVHSSPYSEMTDYTFSPDSKWVAYTEPGRARTYDVIKLYHLETKKVVAVTDQWYASYNPTFSPDGKYLYFVSERDFNPTYSSTEWNHSYSDMAKVYVVRLSERTPSLFALEEDEVRVANTDEKANTKSESTTVEVMVDGDLAERIESLPVGAGYYYQLQPVEGGLYYTSGTSSSTASTKYYSVKDKKEIEIGSFNGFTLSKDLKKVLVRRGKDWYIEAAPTTKLEPKTKINLEGLKIQTDVKAEWKQIYTESWRQMRDYFYDANMHGVNWKAIHDKYAVLLPYVNHRNDLNYIIGEMIGELNAGHAYVNGGDRPSIERVKLGLLGAKFEKDKSGYYKIASILPGLSWDKSKISPLRAPGVNVNEGEYIISINGQDVSKLDNINEALVGKAGQVIEVMVNTAPKTAGSRRIAITPIGDDSALHYQKWVDDNVAKVTKASNGRIGYVHIPDMITEGLNQFARYFYPQLDKEALIIDDRGNGGGNVSPMIIERLLRKPALGVVRRNSTVPTIKPDAQVGPKVCLIDQYSASDGDLFPYQFKYHNIGPLIGQRSWGGVVGIRGTLPFIDGGDLRKPEFAHFAADGSSFVIEGEGVTPNIEVINDPHQEYLGNDTQLERGIQELLKKLQEPGPKGVPNIPAFPNKSK